MRRERGSAFIFVIVVLFMATTLIVASSYLSNQTRNREISKEQYSVATASFQGLLAQVKANTLAGPLTLPVVGSYTVGSVNWSVTVSDNSANLARSVLVTATTTIGNQPYSMTGVVVQRFTPSLMNYAVASNNSLSFLTASLTTGSSGSNGDVYVNGSPSFSLVFPSTINGEIDITGASISGSYSVTGETLTSQSALPFPTPVASTYQSAATTTYGTSQTMNSGITFGAPTGGYYRLIYINGNLSLKGALSGEGTVYVTGSLTLSGSVNYANSSSHVLFIAAGGVNVSLSCSSFVGYYYTNGTFTVSSILSTSLASGSIAANRLSLSGALNVTYDPDIFANPDEPYMLRAPGF